EFLRRVAENPGGEVAIFDVIGTHIDDGGAWLDEVARDHGGAPDGGDEDIGLAADGRQVGRFGMADGDGGVLVQEQEGDRLAYDIAAADDDGAAPGDGNAAALQELENARRGAGSRRGAGGPPRAAGAGVGAR